MTCMALHCLQENDWPTVCTYATRASHRSLNLWLSQSLTSTRNQSSLAPVYRSSLFFKRYMLLQSGEHRTVWFPHCIEFWTSAHELFSFYVPGNKNSLSNVWRWQHMQQYLVLIGICNLFPVMELYWDAQNNMGSMHAVFLNRSIRGSVQASGPLDSRLLHWKGNKGCKSATYTTI